MLSTEKPQEKHCVLNKDSVLAGAQDLTIGVHRVILTITVFLWAWYPAILLQPRKRTLGLYTLRWIVSNHILVLVNFMGFA